MRPLGDGLDLVPHVLLELVGRLGVGGALVVVLAAVVEDEAGVFDEFLGRRVLVGLELRLHGREVHRLLDHLVVIRDVVSVDRVQEGPGRLVVLHVVEKVQELVVVRAVTWLAREFVHIRRPARLADRLDGEGVDRRQAVPPLLGRLVHDV